MAKPDDEAKSPSEEVRSVAPGLPDFAEEALPDFSASAASETNEPLALDPAHEIHVEISVPEPDEDSPGAKSAEHPALCPRCGKPAEARTDPGEGNERDDVEGCAVCGQPVQQSTPP